MQNKVIDIIIGLFLVFTIIFCVYRIAVYDPAINRIPDDECPYQNEEFHIEKHNLYILNDTDKHVTDSLINLIDFSKTHNK